MFTSYFARHVHALENEEDHAEASEKPCCPGSKLEEPYRAMALTALYLTSFQASLLISARLVSKKNASSALLFAGSATLFGHSVSLLLKEPKRCEDENGYIPVIPPI